MDESLTLIKRFRGKCISNLGLELFDGGGRGEMGEAQRTRHSDRGRYDLKSESRRRWSLLLHCWGVGIRGRSVAGWIRHGGRRLEREMEMGMGMGDGNGNGCVSAREKGKVKKPSFLESGGRARV